MMSKIDKVSAFMKHTFWWKDKENKQKASKPIIEFCWRVVNPCRKQNEVRR